MVNPLSDAVVFIVVFTVVTQVSLAFEWTSSSRLSNGTTIPACPGQDVTLAWTYTTAAAEHLTNVEWHYTAASGEEQLLATVVFGNFLPAPSAAQRVEFLPNAGLRLHHVAIADSGIYSVHVNINLHGSVVTQVHRVHVLVSDEPLTTDGQLQVAMMADARYDNSTGQFHLQLGCGNFKPEWGPRTSVVWTTPSNVTLESSSYSNGQFLLSVPNPIKSGEYSCAIEDTSPASLCISRDSPLKQGATLSVDGIQAQLVLMEARMKAMQDSHGEEMAAIRQDNSALRQELQTLRQEEADLRQELRTLTENTSHPNAGRDVSFYAWMYAERLSAAQKLHAYTVHTNNGGHLDQATGVFTSPVNGTYVFLANILTWSSSQKADNVVDIVVDGTVYGRCRSSYSDHYEQGSCHVVLNLHAGQKAWLENLYSGAQYYNDYGTTTFSGFLLTGK